MDFNYPRDHSRAFYNPKGQAYWCHSKDDEARAKEAGYTSASYVRSNWPKAVFHKRTGESKPVGHLDWTDEKNQAAVEALGPDWGLEYVATPEPVAATSAARSSLDTDVLVGIGVDIALMKKRIEELEEAAIQADNVRVTLQMRVAELELAPDPQPATPAVKAGVLSKTPQMAGQSK